MHYALRIMHYALFLNCAAKIILFLNIQKFANPKIIFTFAAAKFEINKK